MRYRPSLRAVVVAVLLLATVLFLHARHGAEIIPRSENLALFPKELAGWTGHDLVIPPSFLEVLGPGDFLSRVYTQPQQTPIDLLLAYFPSQGTGDTIHSPKNCLPGAGWTSLESSHITLAGLHGQANRYVLGKGNDRILVIYWYQAHGRATASEYRAKIHLVADAITMNRTDGALVRFLTGIRRGETPAQSQARLEQFIQPILPLLDRYIPR